jgi:hypothetical protein
LIEKKQGERGAGGVGNNTTRYEIANNVEHF